MGADLDHHPYLVAATARAIAPKEKSAAEAEIPEGVTAHVQLTAHIRATLSRGQATTARPTANLLSKALLGELLRRLGVTRDAFEKHLREVAREALVEGRDLGKSLEDANPELLLAVKRIEDEVLAELPLQPKPGPIKVQATTEFREASVE